MEKHPSSREARMREFEYARCKSGRCRAKEVRGRRRDKSKVGLHMTACNVAEREKHIAAINVAQDTLYSSRLRLTCSPHFFVDYHDF